MLGSDDREEELEADEAVWERLRASAGGRPGQGLSSSKESGSESYGEEPTGAFDRNDPAIANAFEQEDYEESSAIAHSESYELAEDDLESDDDADDEAADDYDELGEPARFDAADEHAYEQDAEEYDADGHGGEVEDDAQDEEDEEALWAQARASLELAHRQDEQAREEAAQRAAYAAYERQSLHGGEGFGQQPGYAAGAFSGEQHYADGAGHESYEGPDAYQRPSHVTPYGYTDDSFGSRHSDVGPVSSHQQAYQGEQSGFPPADYAQAASTGFPPAQAPSAFNQQAWVENFDVPDGASAPRGRGSRVLKGLLGAAVIAAAAGAGAYQFVLLPQQERARSAELAALQAQQQKVIEQERVAKESAARAEAEQRAAAEAALKRAEEAAAAAGGVAAADVATAEPEAGKPKSRAKASEEGGESRAERKARERAERKERREAAKAARAEKRERKAKPADDEEASSATTKRSKKAEKADKADSQAAAEADNNDPLFGL